MATSSTSTGRPRGATSCRALAVILSGVLSAGCEPGQRTFTLDQQIARQVDPVRKQLAERDAAAQAAQREAEERIEELRGHLAAAQEKVADLQKRLETAETALTGYEKMNLTALLESVDTLERDLRRFAGDHTGHVYRTSKQFENNALVHANLEQSDADLRKHIATTVSNLERRSKQARTELRKELLTRFEDDRSVVLSGFRDLQSRVGTGSAHAALTVQLIREFLASERQAMAAREHRLAEVIDEIDRQFSMEEAEARDQRAGELFDKARQLHEDYLADRYHTEALEDAIVAYQQGLTLRPDAADMHFELGKLLRAAERPDDAEPHLLYYLKNGNDPQREEEVRAWLGGQ